MEKARGVDNATAADRGFPTSGDMNAAAGKQAATSNMHKQVQQQPFEHTRPQGRASPQNPFASQAQPVIPPTPAQGSQYSLKPTPLSPAVQSAWRGMSTMPMHQQAAQYQMGQGMSPNMGRPPGGLGQFQLPPPEMRNPFGGAQPSFARAGDAPGAPTPPGAQPPSRQGASPAPVPGGNPYEVAGYAQKQGPDDYKNTGDQLEDPPESSLDSNFEPKPTPPADPSLDPTQSAPAPQGSPKWYGEQSAEAIGKMQEMANKDGVLHKGMLEQARGALQGQYDQFAQMMEESGGMFGQTGNPLVRQQALDSAKTMLNAEVEFAKAQLQVYSQVQGAYREMGNFEMDRRLKEANTIKDAVSMAHEMGLQAGTKDYLSFLTEYMGKAGIDPNSATAKSFTDGLKQEGVFNRKSYDSKLAKLKSEMGTVTNTDEEAVLSLIAGMNAAERAEFAKSKVYQDLMDDFDDDEDEQLAGAMGMEG